MAGKCQKGAAAGTECALYPGFPDWCDRVNGIVCDSLLKSCTPVQVKPVGATCDGPTDVCGGRGACHVFGSSARCDPPIKEGDSCQVTKGPECQFPSTCDLGKCVVPNASACK